MEINLNAYAEKNLREADLQNGGPSLRTESGTDREAFNELLQEVGARTRMEDGKPVLAFNPPLEREEVAPERWAKAQKLESLFWELCEEHGYV